MLIALSNRTQTHLASLETFNMLVTLCNLMPAALLYLENIAIEILSKKLCPILTVFI